MLGTRLSFALRPAGSSGTGHLRDDGSVVLYGFCL